MVTTTLALPETVGAPKIVPFAGSICRPAGSPTWLHEYGGVPPNPWGCARYCCPTTPAGNNNQVALQVGYGNYVSVAQTTGANVTNTSFTAQFGSHNSAMVSQK